MKITEKTELKAYKKPAVRVINIESEDIIAESGGGNENPEQGEDWMTGNN